MTKTTNELALELGLLKAVEDHIKSLTAERKAELRLGQKRGTTYATLEDGGEVATIVSTADVSGEELVVTNEEAFLEWVIANRPTAVMAAVRSSDKEQILAEAKKTGEWPDGVDVVPTNRKGYVQVKQSPAQRQELIGAWRDGRLQPVASLLELEGGDS